MLFFLDLLNQEGKQTLTGKVICHIYVKNTTGLGTTTAYYQQHIDGVSCKQAETGLGTTIE